MLEKKNIKNIYRMSPMQEGIFFQNKYKEDSLAYFLQFSYRIHGNLEFELVEQSLNKVIERYDILRTVFIEKSGKLVQVVLKDRKLDIKYEDLVKYETECEKEEYIQRYMEEDKNRLFNISKDMLMRLCIIRINELEYELIWSFHHILMDGWCVSILINEFLYIYKSLKAGKQPILEEVTAYRDYIKWLERIDRDECNRYWKSYLEGCKENVTIPFNEKINKYNQEYKNADYTFKLNKYRTEELKKIALNNEVTLNTVIKVLWGIILSKYNRKDDIIFGAVVSGRPAEIENVEFIVGLFINTIPIRINFDWDMKFNNYLKLVQDDSIKNEKYQYVSLSDIQRQSELNNKLINHLFIFENYPIYYEETTDHDISIKDVKQFEQTNYDLNIVVTPGEELRINFKYNETKYDLKQFYRIQDNFINLVDQIIKDDKIQLKELELISQKEKERLFLNSSSVKVSSQDKTIHMLFEEQVANRPNNIAVVYNNESLTYKELNIRANQLARELICRGVKSQDIVSIMVERGVNMIIGILAIIKAGAAYLPINPQYPDERIEYMIKDSKTQYLITSKELKKKSNGIINCILIDKDYSMNLSSNLSIRCSGNDLAYVIYTSGTTGNPKGALIEHKNVVNLMLNNNFEFSNKDIWTMFHSFCFDFSVWEMYGALLYGGKLIIVSEEIIRDSEKYLELLSNESVTVLNSTPAAFYNLIDQELQRQKKNLKLRYIVFGGEALNLSRLKKWNEWYPKTKLINMYGITETTVHVTYKEITSKDIEVNISNIGKALPQIKTYVIDENLKLLPIGAVGEICVGGTGVCRGYLYKEELTNEKFIIDPFDNTKKMYRSGDLGKLLENGDIEYVGRKDRQVKIRGYRIELGEIEKALLKIKGITNVVVVDKVNLNGEKQLCAYICSEKNFSSEQIKQILSKELPTYMIPSFIIKIEKIPLTFNGKVDFEGLPTPNEALIIVDSKYEAPRNDIEKIMVKIWEEILGIKQVGINDNFFMIGGDSIKIIQIASKLNRKGYRLEIRDIYENPTIMQLVPLLKINEIKPNNNIIFGDTKLTPIQRYFFTNFKIAPHHYNQSVMIKIEDKFSEELIIKIFTKILEHHDILRAIYKIDNETISQKIMKETILDLCKFDLKNEKLQSEVMEKLLNEMQASIDIENGELLKLGLFNLGESRLLVIIIHHLVIDGVSWRIIFEDIELLYQQHMENIELSLPQKTNSYQTWAEKLSEYSNSDEIYKEIPYWNKVTYAKTNKIKSDFIGENYSKTTQTILFDLSIEETSKLLNKVHQAFNTEINDILITGLSLAIKRKFEIQKFHLMLEGHGREDIFQQVDISRTVGWFTSIYPILINIDAEDELSRQIQEIKEILHEVPNKGIGFGILKFMTKNENVKDIKVDINPQIAFNYLGQFDTDVHQLSWGQVLNDSTGNNSSENEKQLYELNFNGFIKDSKLTMCLTYNTNQYLNKTAEDLLKYYKDELIRIIDLCYERTHNEVTPSDLTYKNLSLDELKNFFD